MQDCAVGSDDMEGETAVFEKVFEIQFAATVTNKSGPIEAHDSPCAAIGA